MITSSCSNVDCVFVTVPYTDTAKPLMALAILKSIATTASKTATVIDINAKFNNFINGLDEATRVKFLAFFREDVVTDRDTIPLVTDYLRNAALDILAYSPKIVGISVFTYNCRAATKYLAWFIKKLSPGTKIILGGAGIMKHFSGAPSFAEELKDYNLIDFYVYGDGEKSLYYYLKNNNSGFAGINTSNWIQLNNKDLSELPCPDYSDYDFSLYEQPVSLPILGSRGCVRSCGFCDQHVHWTKFTYRSGQAVFDEIIKLHNVYGVNRFDFTDSLVNGNMKEYREFARLLAEYNKFRSDSDMIRWSGFFIFRSRDAFTDTDWQLTVESGAATLAVGIETINDQVRRNLGKNFTNDDIKHSFESALQYGQGKTKFLLLFLTGYPGETSADYGDNLVQWWNELIEYREVILAVNTGVPMGILENTPVSKAQDSLGITRLGNNPEDWACVESDNTPANRVKWNKKLVETVQKHGLPILRGFDSHYILEKMKSHYA